MHEAKTFTVGNDEVIGSVCIDVLAHGKYPLLQQRKFFGDYKLTEKDALESENLASLVYLQKCHEAGSQDEETGGVSAQGSCIFFSWMPLHILCLVGNSILFLRK